MGNMGTGAHRERLGIMLRMGFAIAVFALVFGLATQARALECGVDINTVETILRVGEPGPGAGPLNRINLVEARKHLELAKEARARGEDTECELHITEAKKRAGVTY